MFGFVVMFITTVGVEFLFKLWWQRKRVFELSIFCSLCTAVMIIRRGSYFYIAHTSVK